MSDSHKGKPSPKKGKLLSSETKNKIRETIKKNKVGFQPGYVPWNKGLTKYDHIGMMRISEANMGRPSPRKKSKKAILKHCACGCGIIIKQNYEGRIKKRFCLGHYRRGKPLSLSHRKKISVANKGRKMTSEWIKAMLQRSQVKPNKSELKLEEILNRVVPNEYALNVLGNVMILDGKVPDFVNVNGQKRLIELFGEFWHPKEDEELRINNFKKFGWDTLVIWDKELRKYNQSSLEIKILNFNR